MVDRNEWTDHLFICIFSIIYVFSDLSFECSDFLHSLFNGIDLSEKSYYNVYNEMNKHFIIIYNETAGE